MYNPNPSFSSSGVVEDIEDPKSMALKALQDWDRHLGAALCEQALNETARSEVPPSWGWYHVDCIYCGQKKECWSCGPDSGWYNVCKDCWPTALQELNLGMEDSPIDLEEEALLKRHHRERMKCDKCCTPDPTLVAKAWVDRAQVWIQEDAIARASFEEQDRKARALNHFHKPPRLHPNCVTPA